jgi:hypothetical protein
MPTKKRLTRKVSRPSPLKPSEIHLLKTGEEEDFHVFFLSYEDNARELFESVRGDYPAGTFPWAEEKFSGRAEG